MNNKYTRTFLIVTADDFGRSLSVNRAVEKAARKGVLSCASLIISGKEVGDAIRTAKDIPSLQIALHLTLTEWSPVSSRASIPDLLTKDGRFKKSPTQVGLSLQFNKDVEKQIKKEVAAQFKAFAETGLPFRHVDCHHHLYVHPKLFDIVLEQAIKYELKSIRIPNEPWEISGPICKGHAVRNFFYRNVFTRLVAKCRKKIRSLGMVSSDGVFGLYQTEQITEDWVLMLLDRLQGTPGTFELYTHPENEAGSRGEKELKALISPKVKNKLEEKGVKLIRYRDIEK